MVSPGGGLFLRELVGVSMLRWNGFASGRAESSSCGPLPPCFWRCSMIWRCLSLTSMLLWSCSRMVGSWVWKPGDRQASPTSCMMVALSFELMGAGRAVRAPDECTMVWLVERSRRLGRWREVVRSGDDGSFLTTILGAGGPRAESGERLPSALSWCEELSLEEVGEAFSVTSLELLELGVTT